MDQETFSGIIRFALPLFCVALAAVWFNRVGLVNIALDGQIGLGAAAYVATTFYLPALLAFVVALVVVTLVSAVLVEAKERFGLDPFLVGLALLYGGYGGAQVISQGVAGTPGYAQLHVISLGERVPFAIMAVLGTGTWVCLVAVRSLRVAKVIAEAPELAAIQGFSTRWWSHVHGIVAAALITAAAVYLSEHGGSFTSGIAAERGFLALAFVAVAGHRIWMAFGLSLLFGALQKIGYQGAWSIELFEALTYLVAIGLVVWSGIQTAKNFRNVPRISV